MLRDAPMAGLVKPRFGIVPDCGGLVWAEIDDDDAAQMGGFRTFSAIAKQPSRKAGS